MKRLTLIIGITLASMFAAAQGLPESNQKVLDYVESHMFEKVGDGVCHTLVDKALRATDKKYQKKHTGYGKKVELKDALPGDIILFRGCIFTDTASSGVVHIQKAGSHVGIVYSVSGDKITVADQNNGGNGDGEKKRGAVAYEDSHVNTSVTDLSTMKKGKILIYRPY